ncbi:hypothetical protein PHLGIDRAFT_189970 [Phlebiopsis gigantea 11061_1 CR5-6]|uniref:Uncharacterized protein n=1 Tax=Phlebiopsis gigantea (strain 11061_1 CR5-6) TaxID=745531 RepID=A0A0C3PFZ3_PHLG1|nr:hypothetical protein PHLGIDRAFT_189970 [Phlebiopsis gigantea 11061_1 CR5-6]
MNTSHTATVSASTTRPVIKARPHPSLSCVTTGWPGMHDEHPELSFLHFSRELHHRHPTPPRRWTPPPPPQFRTGYRFDRARGEWCALDAPRDEPSGQTKFRVHGYKHQTADPAPPRGVRRPSEEPYPRETKRRKPSRTFEADRTAKRPLSVQEEEETENEGDTDDAIDDAAEPVQNALAKRPLKRSGTGSLIINPQFAQLSISNSAGACRPNIGEVEEQLSTLRLVS